MEEDLRIRPWADTDSVAALTDLLHAAYADLLANGFRYSGSYQDKTTTLSRLQHGIPFVAEQVDEIVATITLYQTSLTSHAEWYRQPGVFHFGQFGVRPDLQGQGIGSRLYAHIEALARKLGAEELALDTAEGAAHLRRWYERLGFRFVQFQQWPSTNYRSVVLSKSLS